MPQSRQLAAIMFTDIVGYTSLMGHDEQKAFEFLKKNRELQKPIIEQFKGRWIKELGDGVMASFNTVYEAVYAAIAIQNACNSAGDFQLRIGIHLGEVIFENKDVFGDGVNIASRIQTIAKPGCIYISESVLNNISNKRDIKTKFVKEEILKNVKSPVKIYEVISNSGAFIQGKNTPEASEKNQNKGTYSVSKNKLIFTLFAIVGISISSYLLLPTFNIKKNITNNKWIAILPFRLISSDSGMEWLSNGFTEELTSSVAAISDMKVKSPATMMLYKNSKQSIRNIGQELNVSNIIDGSIQKEGNNIIINAQMISPITEEILHNFKFKKDASEIKSIYSEVAQQVASILNVTITSKEKQKLRKVQKVDPELYNLYLQGMNQLKSIDAPNPLEAIKIFDKAIKRDSNYVPVIVGKAHAIISMAGWNSRISRTEAIKQLDPMFIKSFTLDSNFALAYASRGISALLLKWDFNNGEKDLLTAFSLDPTNNDAIFWLMFLNMYIGNYKEANKWWETGKAISPLSDLLDLAHSQTLYLLGKTNEAIQFAQDQISNYGKEAVLYEKLGWIYSLTGQHKEAIEILEKGMRMSDSNPPSTLTLLASSYFKSNNKIKSTEIFQVLEDLVQSETPNVAVYTARAYASIGEKKLALDYLDKAYQLHDVDMIWLKSDPHFSSLQNEARYQEMLKKIGF